MRMHKKNQQNRSAACQPPKHTRHHHATSLLLAPTPPPQPSSHTHHINIDTSTDGQSHEKYQNYRDDGIWKHVLEQESKTQRPRAAPNCQNCTAHVSSPLYFPMDHGIAERCSGHPVMMVCCATEKNDSTQTPLKTAGFRTVRTS